MHKTICLGVALSLAVGCASGDRVPYDEARARYPDEDYSSPERWREVATKYYPPAYHDYFEDMDGIGTTDAVGARKLALTPEGVKGRNAWVLWAAGNEAFWDWLARNGYGSSDLLKVIDSNDRGRRFARTGLMTEPGTRPPTPQETKEAYGIRYDRPIKAGEPLKPGEKVHVEYLTTNSNGTTRAPPKYEVYGYPTGVVGLRLFKNPEFTAAAERRWNEAHKNDPERYYNDPSYASRPDTIRPFRVGMSCGYCHVAPHPLRPPADPEFPEWENLSNNIGNQYLRFRASFGNTLKPDNYLYHVLDAQLPGALDTSLIPSDNNNNPNTINSFFGLPGRLARARFNPRETIGADSLAYLRTYVDKKGEKFENPHHVPRVLLDGSDSVGVHIALSRVYLNIGTHHQQWIRLHNPLLGFREQKPFKLRDIAENSLYWHATLIRIDPLAEFFTLSTDPMRLKDVVLPAKPNREHKKGGDEQKAILVEHLRGTGLPWYAEHAKEKADGPKPLPVVGATDKGDYAKGRAAFAKGCVACHSSVQPGDLPELEAMIKGRYPRANPEQTAPKKDEPKKEEPKKDDPRERSLIPVPDGFPRDWTPETLADGLKEKLAAAREPLRLSSEDRARLARGDGTLPPAYAEWAQEAVKHRVFWEPRVKVRDKDGKEQFTTFHNYLSIDERVPVTVTHTNSGRAAATNALHGHIWEDFASQTYKELGSVGQVHYRDPFSGAQKSYELPAGGPGLYRVPTLISIWATAPFLHNNALGTFNNDPSVKGRLDSFDDSIRRLLWTERRLQPSVQHVWDPDQEPRKVYDGWYEGKRKSPGDPKTGDLLTGGARAGAERQLASDRGWVWRTTEESWLRFEGHHVPQLVGGIIGLTPGQMKIAPGIPSLLFVLVGTVLLLNSRLVDWREALELRFTILGWLFAPVRWLFAVAGLALAVGGVYLIVTFWPLITLLDIGTQGSIWGLRALAILVPVVLGLSVALIFFHHRLRAATVGEPLVVNGAPVERPREQQVELHRRRMARAAWANRVGAVFGVACFVLAVLLAVGPGRFLAGHGESVRVGPIPEGVPVNVLANMNPEAPSAQRRAAVAALVDFFLAYNKAPTGQKPGREEFEADVAPALMNASKCPDLVTDRGHDYEFIRRLTDEEKEELIALLKTF